VREGGRVEAQGDVHVRGDIHQASVTSTAGRITVEGQIGGTAQQPGDLRAHGSIICEGALHATIQTDSDIHIRSEARHTTLQAGGHVYLRRLLQESLFDAHLRLGGGVVPPVEPVTAVVSPTTERRHARVSLELAARIAVHDTPPNPFHPCVIEDLSPSGARCRLIEPFRDGDPPPGTVMQLKITLPDRPDDVPVIAYVARLVESGSLGLAFVQITERDGDHLMAFCMRILRQQDSGASETRANRKTHR